MRYLGIDVHSRASVWCLVDGQGVVVDTGKTPTQTHALQSLVRRLRGDESLRCAQEMGTQAYLVHDAIAETGAEIVSFNPNHFRMIAASRKKSDRRDAYWLARGLQTGLTPHPVYIPPPTIRTLRRLLQRRRALVSDRKRWHGRARATLRAHGHLARPGRHNLSKLVEEVLEQSMGLERDVLGAVGMSERFIAVFDEEVAYLDGKLAALTREVQEAQRLQTIPGIGPVTAMTIYACVGDIRRFPNARLLCAYAGLVPSVRQSGQVALHGRITKQGSGPLRSALIQGAHRVSVSKSSKAAPLACVYQRIRGSRGRRKIALVALARHLLRISYYVWRDNAEYDPQRVRTMTP